jgi:hypothetical protein
MFDYLTGESCEKPPHKTPLEAKSLDNLAIRPADQQRVKNAANQFDFSLMRSALREIKDCFMYNLPSIRSGEFEDNFFMRQFVERQRRTLLTVVGDQIDKTGLSKVLSEIAPLFVSYDFTNADFYQVRSDFVIGPQYN